MDAAGDIQLYVRLISGMVLGLTVGKLFTGIAKFVQHPEHNRINSLHALWSLFIFTMILTFWWEEAHTFSHVNWSFWLYTFQIVYCASFLFIASILLPDDAKGFDSHYDYLIARRAWFYGALVVNFLLSVADTVIKEGWEDFMLNPLYLALNAAVLAILVTGMISTRHRVHIWIAMTMLVLIGVSMLAE